MQRRATWRIVAARAVHLERYPGRLCADVPVDRAARRGLGQRRPEAGALDLGADRAEAGLDGGDHLLVGLAQRPRGRNRPEVPVRALEHPIDEVAPGGNELVVVAPHELRPREVGVAVSGPAAVGSTSGCRRCTGRGSRRRGRRRSCSSRTACPPWSGTRSRRRRRAARGPPPWRRPARLPPVAEQLGEPDHRVEDDVVLAHEVEVARPRLCHQRRHASASPVSAAHSSRRRQVAGDRIDPDVDALVVAARRSRPPGRGRPSRDRASRAAATRLVQELEREPADVRPPVARLRSMPRRPISGHRQVEEEVRLLPELGRSPSTFERGSIRSCRSNWTPQLSHWSPRASRKSADRARALGVAVEAFSPWRRRTRPSSSARRGSLVRTASGTRPERRGGGSPSSSG